MAQENIVSKLSQVDQEVLEQTFNWKEKASNFKEGYAAIARQDMDIVLHDGVYKIPLNGVKAYLFSKGKTIARCDWKREDGFSKFPLTYSTHVDKSGKISFCGSFWDATTNSAIVFGSTKHIEQEIRYDLLICAWDDDTGYLWMGDNQSEDEGITRIDYMISGNTKHVQKTIEYIIEWTCMHKTIPEGNSHE